jgi:hypothetical protein
MPRQYLQDFDIPIILHSAIGVNKDSSMSLHYNYFMLLSRCCELCRCRRLLLCCSYYCVAAAAAACCAAVVVCRPLVLLLLVLCCRVLPSPSRSLGNIAKYCRVTRQYRQVLPGDLAILPSDLAILPSTDK